MFLSADQFLGYDPSSAEWTVWVVRLPPGANSHTTPFMPKNSRHAASAPMPREAPIASTSALRITGGACSPSDPPAAISQGPDPFPKPPPCVVDHARSLRIARTPTIARHRKGPRPRLRRVDPPLLLPDSP